MTLVAEGLTNPIIALQHKYHFTVRMVQCFNLQYMLTIGWSFEAHFRLVLPDIWKIMAFPAVPT